MTKVKSLMTDRSWQLVTAIQATMTGTPSTAEVIEMALSTYLHGQAEYAVALRALELVQADAPAVDPRPWIDAGTPPEDFRDVEAMLDGKNCVKAWYADDCGGWRIYPAVGKNQKIEYAGDLGVTVTAWRELAPADPAAPGAELRGAE